MKHSFPTRRSSDLDAVHLVSRDVAVDPLDRRSELVQDAAGLAGDGCQVLLRQVAGARDVALDYETRVVRVRVHVSTLLEPPLGTLSWRDRKSTRLNSSH